MKGCEGISRDRPARAKHLLGITFGENGNDEKTNELDDEIERPVGAPPFTIAAVEKTEGILVPLDDPVILMGPLCPRPLPTEFGPRVDLG